MNLKSHAIQIESNELTSNQNKYTENDNYLNTPTVSHVQEKDKQQNSYDDKDNTIRKIMYGPTYVPFKEGRPENSVATVYGHVTKRQSQTFI